MDEKTTTRERIILAVDFDDTIAHSDFPTIKGEVKNAKLYLNKLYDDGYYIIIWTCRSDLDMLEAEDWLLTNGFKFHKINACEPRGVIKYGRDFKESRKVYAHCYIDNLNVGGLKPWNEIYRWIKTNVKL